MREQKYSHWRKQCTDIQGERKRVDEGLKLKVSTVDIRIKKSGLKFIHSKVPSSGLQKNTIQKPRRIKFLLTHPSSSIHLSSIAEIEIFTETLIF